MWTGFNCLGIGLNGDIMWTLINILTPLRLSLLFLLVLPLLLVLFLTPA
jgi:hypothetical protein